MFGMAITEGIFILELRWDLVGLVFLIKKTLLNDFDVSMLDDTYEGILWLKLIHKQGGDSIVCCVCYLPPINSTRNVDSSKY